VRPLVTSHGANDPRTDRPRLWRLFDWPGTTDPTPFLVLPVAIRTLAALHPDGLAGLMAENHATAVRGRRRLLAAIGGDPIAPESMLGSMAAVALPRGVADTDAAAIALRDGLALQDDVEVPISGWPVPAVRERADAPSRHALLRISCQRYVEDVDLERLVAALARRGIANRASAATLAG